MIPTLYDVFKHWSEKGSVYILSDLHLDDEMCKLTDKDWLTPQEQIKRINSIVHKYDTFVCLGDVGKAEYIKYIKSYKKILILGNHDTRGKYSEYFDEIYTGPLFISDRILLSHEPIFGLNWCLNIHGHDHSKSEIKDDTHINLAANVCDYTPVSLAKIIKSGILKDIPGIHRVTIDNAIKHSHKL